MIFPPDFSLKEMPKTPLLTLLFTLLLSFNHIAYASDVDYKFQVSSEEPVWIKGSVFKHQATIQTGLLGGNLDNFYDAEFEPIPTDYGTWSITINGIFSQASIGYIIVSPLNCVSIYNCFPINDYPSHMFPFDIPATTPGRSTNDIMIENFAIKDAFSLFRLKRAIDRLTKESSYGFGVEIIIPLDKYSYSVLSPPSNFISNSFRMPRTDTVNPTTADPTIPREFWTFDYAIPFSTTALGDNNIAPSFFASFKTQSINSGNEFSFDLITNNNPPFYLSRSEVLQFVFYQPIGLFFQTNYNNNNINSFCKWSTNSRVDSTKFKANWSPLSDIIEVSLSFLDTWPERISIQCDSGPVWSRRVQYWYEANGKNKPYQRGRRDIDGQWGSIPGAIVSSNFETLNISDNITTNETMSQYLQKSLRNGDAPVGALRLTKLSGIVANIEFTNRLIIPSSKNVSSGDSNGGGSGPNNPTALFLGLFLGLFFGIALLVVFITLCCFFCCVKRDTKLAEPSPVSLQLTKKAPAVHQISPSPDPLQFGNGHPAEIMYQEKPYSGQQQEYYHTHQPQSAAHVGSYGQQPQQFQPQPQPYFEQSQQPSIPTAIASNYDEGPPKDAPPAYVA
jgi:hypothetical protein